MTKKILFIIIFISFCHIIFGDKIVLNEGIEIYGEIKSRKDGVVKIDTGISVININEKEIRKIEPGMGKSDDEILGDKFFNDGEFNTALMHYEKAFLKNTKSLSLLRKINATKEEIEKNIFEVSDEENVSDIINRAKELEDKLWIEDAKNLLNKALEKFPDGEGLYLELAKIYKSENSEEYYNILEVLINKWDEKYYPVYAGELLDYYRGKIYYYTQTKDFEKAENFLSKAISFSPTVTNPLTYKEYKKNDLDMIRKAALSIVYCKDQPYLNLKNYLLAKHYKMIEGAFSNEPAKYYTICAPVVGVYLKGNAEKFISANDFEQALSVLKKLIPISPNLKDINSVDDYLLYKNDKVYQLSMISKWALENDVLGIVGLANKELLSINPEDEKGWENIKRFIEKSTEQLIEMYRNGKSLELIVVQYKELEKFESLIKDDAELNEKIEDVRNIIHNEQESKKHYKDALDAYNEKRYQDAKLDCDYILTNLGGTRIAEDARELEIKCDREIGYARLVEEANTYLLAGDYYSAFDVVTNIENSYEDAMNYDAEKIREMKYNALDQIFSDQFLQAQTMVRGGDYLDASKLLSELVFTYSLYYEKPYWNAERFLSQCREALSDKHKGRLSGIVRRKVDTQYFPFGQVNVYVVNGMIEEPSDIDKIIKGRGFVDKDITDKNGKYEIKNLPMGDYSIIFYRDEPYSITKIVRKKIVGNQVEVLDEQFGEF